MVPSLAAGQIEVGGGGISTALVNAVSRDVPLRLIADKGSLRPGFGYEALVVRKELADSGAAQSAADLKGRKIALNTLTSVDIYLLDALLEREGLRLEDVSTEELPYPDMITALANGAVDAAICLEPIVTAMLTRGVGSRLLTFDTVVPNTQLSSIMFSPNFMRDQPEAARRFAIAYLRGVRDYNRGFTTGEGRDEVIQTLIKHTAIKDPRVFETMVLPGLNPNGYLNAENIIAAQQFWLRRGLVQNIVPPDQLVDHSYVDAANAVLGRAAD
jgi:NitT/TauT family transport system substrate-binding protein